MMLTSAQQPESDASVTALSNSWSTVRMQKRKLPPENQIASQLSSSSGPPVAARLLISLALADPSAHYVSNLSESFANLHAWPSVIARAVFPPHLLSSDVAQPDGDLFEECALALSGLKVTLANPRDTSAATPLQQLALGLQVKPSADHEGPLYSPIPQEPDYQLAEGVTAQLDLEFEAELAITKTKTGTQRARKSAQPTSSTPNRASTDQRKLLKKSPRSRDPFMTVPLGRDSFHASAPSLSRRNSVMKPSIVRNVPRAGIRNNDNSGPVRAGQEESGDPRTEAESIERTQSALKNPSKEDDEVGIDVTLGPDDGVEEENPVMEGGIGAEQRNLRRGGTGVEDPGNVAEENVDEDKEEDDLAEEDEYERDEDGEIMYKPNGEPVRRLGSKAGQLGGLEGWRQKMRELNRIQEQKLEERRREVTPLVAPTDTGFARLEQRRQKTQKRKEIAQAKKEKEKARVEKEIERKRKIAKKKKKRAAAQKGQAYVSESEFEDEESEEEERDQQPEIVENVNTPSNSLPKGVGVGIKRQRIDPTPDHLQPYNQVPNSASMQTQYGHPPGWEGGREQFYQNSHGAYGPPPPGSWQTAPGPPSRGAQPGPASSMAPSGPPPYSNSYGHPQRDPSYASPTSYPPHYPHPGPPTSAYPPPQGQYGYDPRFRYAPPYPQDRSQGMHSAYSHQSSDFAPMPRASETEFRRKRDELMQVIGGCSKDLREQDAREIDAFLDNQLYMFQPSQDQKDYILQFDGNRTTKLRIMKRDRTWSVVQTRNA